MLKETYFDRLQDLLAPGLAVLDQYGLKQLPGQDGCKICQLVYDTFCEEYPDSLPEKENLFLYLSAAAHSFLIFRKLHDRVKEDPETCTLLGDYFFSVFSDFLIPVDSTPVVLAFSGYLKQDVESRAAGKQAFEPDEYGKFLVELIRGHQI